MKKNNSSDHTIAKKIAYKSSRIEGYPKHVDVALKRKVSARIKSAIKNTQ